MTKGNAIEYSKCADRPVRAARRTGLVALCATLAVGLPSPASAQNVVNEDDISLSDVMLSPLNDLNLRRDPIPPVLVRAHAATYDDVGLTTCSLVTEEIGNLDAVLGEDFDTAQRRVRQGGTPQRVARGVVSGFIPFRGVIRHLTGAERHELEFREAITAGLARRAYLKGLGQGMGCSYPARPAPPDLLVRPEGMMEEREQSASEP